MATLTHSLTSLLLIVDAEDKNAEQVHKRMVVHVNVVGEEEFSIVVQGRDTVLSVLRCVESRIGIAPSQLKISYSGVLLTSRCMRRPKLIFSPHPLG